HNPSTLNPTRGFVSSANQHSVDSTYPYYVFDTSFEHYRNRRLNSRLHAMTDIGIEDMKALQFDSFHLHASEALPVMIDYLLAGPALSLSSEEEQLVTELRGWDFHTSPDQGEPPLFSEWWRRFEELAWGKWKQEGRPIMMPNSYQTPLLLREDPENEIFDHP